MNNGSVARIDNLVDTSRSQVFAYDELNRVSRAESDSTLWGNTYVYDRYGNLLQKNQIAGKQEGESLTQAVNSNNLVVGLSYDSAGNTTNDGVLSYTWDAEDRLTATNGVTYLYDGDNRRVKNSRLYWHDLQGNVVLESDFAGAVTGEYVFAGGTRIAKIAGSTVSYYFGDHLGSGRVMTNATGQVVQESDFYPFGGERVVVSGADHYKFTGHERDAESGLDHTLYRMYSSRLGRWLSSDPASCGPGQPQGENKYAYVMNDAMNFTDPLGLWGEGGYVADDGSYRFSVSVSEPYGRGGPPGIGGRSGKAAVYPEKGSGPRGEPMREPRTPKAKTPKPPPQPPAPKPNPKCAENYLNCLSKADSQFSQCRLSVTLLTQVSFGNLVGCLGTGPLVKLCVAGVGAISMGSIVINGGACLLERQRKKEACLTTFSKCR